SREGRTAGPEQRRGRRLLLYKGLSRPRKSKKCAFFLVWRLLLIGLEGLTALFLVPRGSPAEEALLPAEPKTLVQQPRHVGDRAGVAGSARYPRLADLSLEEAEPQAGFQPRAHPRPGQPVIQRGSIAAVGQRLAAVGTNLPLAAGLMPLAGPC